MKIHVGWFGLVIAINVFILYNIQHWLDVGYSGLIMEDKIYHHGVYQKLEDSVLNEDYDRTTYLITSLKNSSYGFVNAITDELSESPYSVLIKKHLDEADIFLKSNKENTVKSDLTNASN